MKEKLKDNLETIVALCVIIAMTFGAFLYFTPRSLFNASCAAEQAQIKNIKAVQQTERAISRLERKILQYTLEWQSNSTWLNDLEKNFPTDDSMSTDLKRQRKKITKRQEKIQRKLDRYEQELEDLEQEMEKLRGE
jgi:DNA repair exonuclease SbcCD ATPase subunit